MTKSTTAWTAAVATTDSDTSPTGTFAVRIDGGTPQPFVAKGVCYSPCPIGGSNAFGPAIGDWFWDSFDGVTSWSGTWQRDLPVIAGLGANLIRVYCMLAEQLPANPPAPDPTLFTHTDFLDRCWDNGLYVLVGIPLPQTLFCLGQTPTPDEAWWTDTLALTVAQLGGHPAVLGFTIANEVDNGAVDTYGPTANADYWWSQVEAMARIAKTATPEKLVGIANHDDPGICAHCQDQMARCPSIDFWGVNSYQPQSFVSVFGTPGGSTSGYATLTGAACKPVLLTEYGFPATSRPDALDPTGIYSSPATEARTAAVLNAMLPAAYAEPLNIGVCYFEYCDEWWNQSGFTVAAGTACPGASGPDAPNGGAGGSFAPPDVFSWYGGPVACGFPNYYWDNDGFGLYAVAAGAGRDPAQPWNSAANAPALPLDTRTPRAAVIAAVSTAWGAL